MQKNVASQKWIVFAFDRTTNAAKTGDAANITGVVWIDGVTNTIDDTNPTELAHGYYAFDITAAESNGDYLVIDAVSSTANIQVVGCPMAVWTNPPNFPALGIESDGDAHADLKQWLGVAPNVLQSGRVDGYIGALAAAVITAAGIATDAIGSDEFAQAAADKVWATTVRALTDKAGFTISGAKTTLDALNDITAASVKTAMEAGGSYLALIKAVTDAIPDAGALTTLTAYVDELETRLSAVRASYLDNLNNAQLLNIPNLSALTAARIAYLDNLSAGAVALEATLTAIKGAGWCYSDDTEVLTNEGWKLFNDLNHTELIATLNSKTDYLEYQKPTAYPIFDYQGSMYQYSGQAINFKVSPNHRHWVRKGGMENFELAKIDGLSNKWYEVKKDGIWEGNREDNFILPSIKLHKVSRGTIPFDINVPAKKVPMNTWLEFFGLWLAEGSIYKRKDPTPQYKISLSNKDIGVLRRVSDLLQSFGIKTRLQIRRNGKASDVSCLNKQLFSYLEQFGHAGNKFLPPEVKALSPDQLRILLESLVMGDGHISVTGATTYYTSSRRLADDIQEVLLKAGWAGTITQTKSGFSGKTEYNIHFVKKRLTPIINSSHYRHCSKIVPYSGKIYSVSVPNKIIYVRRNGRPMWSGNSDETLKAIKDVVDTISGTVIAGLVWDELIAGHLGAGSTGEALNSAGGGATPAAIAIAVWNALLASHQITGSAGKKLDDIPLAKAHFDV